MDGIGSRAAARIVFRRGSAAVVLAALAACGGGGGDAPLPAAPGPAAPSGGGPSGGGPSGGDTGTTLQRGDFRVNEATEGRQQGARIARLSGGGFVAVWVHPSASGPGEVRMRRFDARARPVGGETVVTTSGTVPDVAALADGGFVVTWTDVGAGADETGTVQVFDSQGAPRGAATTSRLAPFGYTARPAGLRDGNFVIAFDGLSGRQGTDFGALQVHGPDGRPLNQPVTVNDDPADNRTHVLGIVASPRDGGFAAAWAVSAPAGSQVLFGLFGADGNPVAGFVSVDAGPAEKRFPSLATLADGSFVLAWAAIEAGAGGSSHTLVVERLDAAGRSLGRQTVATGPLDRPFELEVAATGDGGFVVASASTVATGLGENQRTVTAQRFDAGGRAAGAAETIAQFALPSLALGVLDSLDVAGAGGGEYVLVYGRHSPATDWDVDAAVR